MPPPAALVSLQPSAYMPSNSRPEPTPLCILCECQASTGNHNSAWMRTLGFKLQARSQPSTRSSEQPLRRWLPAPTAYRLGSSCVSPAPRGRNQPWTSYGCIRGHFVSRLIRLCCRSEALPLSEFFLLLARLHSFYDGHYSNRLLQGDSELSSSYRTLCFAQCLPRALHNLPAVLPPSGKVSRSVAWSDHSSLRPLPCVQG